MTLRIRPNEEEMRQVVDGLLLATKEGDASSRLKAMMTLVDLFWGPVIQRSDSPPATDSAAAPVKRRADVVFRHDDLRIVRVLVSSLENWNGDWDGDLRTHGYQYLVIEKEHSDALKNLSWRPIKTIKLSRASCTGDLIPDVDDAPISDRLVVALLNRR